MRPMGAELLLEDRQRDMTNIRVTLRSFAKEPQKLHTSFRRQVLSSPQAQERKIT